eukprot:3006981-Pleurochrysis_carterae.AAC.1
MPPNRGCDVKSTQPEHSSRGARALTKMRSHAVRGARTQRTLCAWERARRPPAACRECSACSSARRTRRPPSCQPRQRRSRATPPRTRRSHAAQTKRAEAARARANAAHSRPMERWGRAAGKLANVSRATPSNCTTGKDRMKASESE